MDAITKYYADRDGNYIGAFYGETGKVPKDAVEVSHPPEHASQKWNGGEWGERQDFSADALRNLEKTDIVILRCYESGVQVPGEWADYRSKLREIAAGGSAEALPVKPDYPINNV